MYDERYNTTITAFAFHKMGQNKNKRISVVGSVKQNSQLSHFLGSAGDEGGDAP